MAVPDFVESATEVAVTDTRGGLGTADGAVYSPLADMVPHVAPEQPMPATLHETALFVEFAIVAVNCCWLPVTSCTVAGETVTKIGRKTVTEAVPDFVGSATEVAVTKTCGGLGTVDGAVYKPLADIVPHDAPAQPPPAMLHDTAVFVVFAIVAVNCWWPPGSSCTVAGDTVTETGGRTVTEAVADFVGSATEVAVTNTCGGLGTVDGAVYSPLADMFPQLAPEQPPPAMLHNTAVFIVPVTVAVNCLCVPALT